MSMPYASRHGWMKKIKVEVIIEKGEISNHCKNYESIFDQLI